jgi:hypothetical protein
LASFYGARIAEVPIKNINRPNGRSHYGLGRMFNVLFDIITIKFLLSHLTRPMHLFGRAGLAGTATGGLILAYLLVYKIAGNEIVPNHTPLMMAGIVLLLAGLVMFTTGILGEVMMRTYFESQGRRIYAVREIRSQESDAKGARKPSET